MRGNLPNWAWVSVYDVLDSSYGNSFLDGIGYGGYGYLAVSWESKHMDFGSRAKNLLIFVVGFRCGEQRKRVYRSWTER